LIIFKPVRVPKLLFVQIEVTFVFQRLVFVNLRESGDGSFSFFFRLIKHIEINLVLRIFGNERLIKVPGVFHSALISPIDLLLTPFFVNTTIFVNLPILLPFFVLFEIKPLDIRDECGHIPQPPQILV
jgi:hypothetical protein